MIWLFRLMSLVSLFSVLLVSAVWAESTENRETEQAAVSLPQAVESEVTATSDIPRLSDLDQPATSGDEWLTEIAQSIVQITAVRVNATEQGLEIVLQTEQGTLTVPTSTTVGNALIADIPNATLLGGEFSQANPIEGIALVSVTGLPGDRVRVAITGTDAPPVAEVRAAEQELVVSVTPGAAGTAAEEDEIQVVVTGEQDEGYNPSSATTATRTDTPLRDIPASIQVIPQEVIEDQGVTTLRDAVQNNAPGVVVQFDSGGVGAFNLRGFTQGFNLRNGFRDSSNFVISDFADVERVEVLRGPASILFGQLQPGGIINTVTEQPLSEPTYTVELQAGQFSFYRPTLDFSGPLTEDGDLLYRLNVAYENSGSFRDFVYTERVFVAPVLQWNISENTTLTAEFAYLHDNSLSDDGVVALSDGSLVLPIERYLGYPSLNDYPRELYRAGYRFEHRFSDDWQIRNAFSLVSYFAEGFTTSPGALTDDRFLSINLNDDEYRVEIFGFQTDLIGNFATGSIQHQLLAGVELTRNTDVIGSGSRGAALPPIDIFNPDYDVSRPDNLSESYYGYYRTFFTDSLGIYLQDQVTLLDNLKLLIGGRLDFAEQRENLLGTETTQSDSAFSPRVGIVYQPIEPLSLYASYSRSFFPVVGRSRTNEVFVPERGTQYEIGIKADITDDLSATLAAFDITKSNVRTTDPADPTFSIQVGEQRSRGIELTIGGEILPGWNIFAGYAYTDARVSEDNRIPEDDILANAPENTANLWTTYEIQGGDFQGLGFGFGLLFVGERQATLPNSNLQLPSFVRADTALFYRRNNWRAAININNLFDVEYYESAFARTYVFPGAPLNVTASFSITF